MNDWSVTIMLKFPAMPLPRRVSVSPRELHFLDRNTERHIEPDGTVIYFPTPKMRLSFESCVTQ